MSRELMLTLLGSPGVTYYLTLCVGAHGENWFYANFSFIVGTSDPNLNSVSASSSLLQPSLVPSVACSHSVSRNSMARVVLLDDKFLRF